MAGEVEEGRTLGEGSAVLAFSIGNPLLMLCCLCFVLGH